MFDGIELQRQRLLAYRPGDAVSSEWRLVATMNPPDACSDYARD